MCSDGTPSPGEFWANLRRPMPLGLKVRLVFRNNWRKIRHLKPCCGRPGEPGC